MLSSEKALLVSLLFRRVYLSIWPTLVFFLNEYSIECHLVNIATRKQQALACILSTNNSRAWSVGWLLLQTRQMANKETKTLQKKKKVIQLSEHHLNTKQVTINYDIINNYDILYYLIKHDKEKETAILQIGLLKIMNSFFFLVCY